MHKFSKKLLMETYVLSIKVYIVKKGTKNKQTGDILVADYVYKNESSTNILYDFYHIFDFNTSHPDPTCYINMRSTGSTRCLTRIFV